MKSLFFNFFLLAGSVLTLGNDVQAGVVSFGSGVSWWSTKPPESRLSQDYSEGGHTRTLCGSKTQVSVGFDRRSIRDCSGA